MWGETIPPAFFFACAPISVISAFALSPVLSREKNPIFLSEQS